MIILAKLPIKLLSVKNLAIKNSYRMHRLCLSACFPLIFKTFPRAAYDEPANPALPSRVPSYFSSAQPQEVRYRLTCSRLFAMRWFRETQIPIFLLHYSSRQHSNVFSSFF